VPSDLDEEAFLQQAYATDEEAYLQGATTGWKGWVRVLGCGHGLIGRLGVHCWMRRRTCRGGTTGVQRWVCGV